MQKLHDEKGNAIRGDAVIEETGHESRTKAGSGLDLTLKSVTSFGVVEVGFGQKLYNYAVSHAQIMRNPYGCCVASIHHSFEAVPIAKNLLRIARIFSGGYGGTRRNCEHTAHPATIEPMLK